MNHKLPELPFSFDSLEPFMSKETLEFHHEKHHKAYVEKTNKLIIGTEFEHSSLEDIVLKAEGPIFNQGAQAWNHTFFWHSLAPARDARPRGRLSQAIANDFGTFDAFREKFKEKALEVFGSGWLWIVQKSNGKLAIEGTSNADNPLRHGRSPLLTCDLWEHAYYIDYRNDRGKFIDAFFQLANWDFAEENLKRLL